MGHVDEKGIGIDDETHFTINFNNCRIFRFAGLNYLQYADVVSGVEGFTMVVRLIDRPDAQFIVKFMDFENKNLNFPILVTPDTIEGVEYFLSVRSVWIST